MTGQKFNRLTVIERAEDYVRPSGKKTVRFKCLCDCGNTIITHSSTLKNGDTQSCGCLNRELAAARRITHGATYTNLYEKWCQMKQRCYNPKQKHYADYGGRGITICDTWLNNFEAFREWAISTGYQTGLTIDRIDNDKGYSPDNCRWATMDDQRRNTRQNVQLLDGDTVITAADLARLLGIPSKAVYRWVATRGYTTRAEIEEHAKTKYRPPKDKQT